MPISGLVITLKEDSVPDLLLEKEPFELGCLHHRKLPAVLETESSDEDKKYWQWINSLPSVEKVDVVFVSFEGDDQ